MGRPPTINEAKFANWKRGKEVWPTENSEQGHVKLAAMWGEKVGINAEDSYRILLDGTGGFAEFKADLDVFAADQSQQTHPVRVAGVGRSLQSPAGLRSITAGRKGLKGSRRPGLFFDPKDLVAEENDRRRRANFTILGQPKRRTLLDSNRTPFP